MIDLKLETPVSEEIEVDGETSAAIENGIQAADDGRTVPLDEERKAVEILHFRHGQRRPPGL